MKLHLLSCLMPVACLMTLAHASANWGCDMPAALAQAAKEDKVVLADFNGSDWCGPCIALRREVLDKEDFIAYAASRFVLVDVDIPRRKQMPEGQLETNKALMKTYNVGLFPTILVISKDGVALGGFSGGSTSLAPVELDLERALSRKAKVDELMALAAQSEGDTKTQALIDAYECIPMALQGFNEALLQQIVAADPEDKLGFMAGLAAAKEARQQAVLKEQELSLRVNRLPINERLTLVEELLAQPDMSADDIARLKWLRLNTLFLLCETTADLDEVKAAMMDFANSLDAEGKEKTLSIIHAIFASEPSELLERIRNMRGNEPS